MTEKTSESHPQMRPASPAQTPDTARVYERAKPEKEAGMGRLDNNVAVPEKQPDNIESAVLNKQPNRQLNAHDVVNGQASRAADGKRLKD